MKISNEAVEAADAAYRSTVPTGDGSYQRRAMRAALEAAALFIRAEALEDAADHIMGPSDVLLDGATCRWNAMELRERAAEMRQP